MNAAQQLATAEKVLNEDMPLLLTAALLHDIGFIETVKNHEEKSCDIACKLLPSYGFDAATIEVVCELIMVTRLPQQAQTHLAANLMRCRFVLSWVQKHFFALEKTCLKK